MTASVPVLDLTVGSRRNWLQFSKRNTREWKLALQALKTQGFRKNRERKIVGIDEGILPNFSNGNVEIAAGWDDWVGDYLLANCDSGDLVIEKIAQELDARDIRKP